MKNILLQVMGYFFVTTVTLAQSIDPQSDTWVCNDGLNRVVASSDNGVTRTEIDTTCSIGMFYYIWHGQHGEEVKDITRILAADVNNPQWGAYTQFHWGSKPALGYYAGGDPFIVSRHMQMLTDAGIDFYFFDVTNGFTYDDNVKVVMNEIDRRDSLGLKTPKLVFLSNTNSEDVVKHIYTTYYSDTAYNKYWFYWNDKPLTLSSVSGYNNLSRKLQRFFTHRHSWAWKEGENLWPWLSNYPQYLNYTIDDNNKRVNEQISVSVAQHPYSKIGKSYHDGKQPEYDAYGLCKETPYGYYFAEQWKQAHEKHPQVIMITQWNEWMAQRFIIEKESQFKNVRPGATAAIGETYFVDIYNQEFSRDIEPCADSLIRDNYYLQMVSNIRQYKGVHTIPVPTVSKTIRMDGEFSQWNDVLPDYIDEPGDAYYTSDNQHSESRVRTTNDFVRMKVTKDKENMFFYAEVNDSLILDATSAGLEKWMSLLLNTDIDYQTGWEGYDYMVSLNPNSNKILLYKYNQGDTPDWAEIEEIEYTREGNKIMYRLPKSLLQISGECDIDFKWIDNTPSSSREILDFLLDGDVAPNGRFNYRYKGSLLESNPVGMHATQLDKGISPISYANGSIKALQAHVNIYDVSGKLIATLSAGQQKSLPAGTYIAKYSYEGKTASMKFNIK